MHNKSGALKRTRDQGPSLSSLQILKASWNDTMDNFLRDISARMVAEWMDDQMLVLLSLMETLIIF